MKIWLDGKDINIDTEGYDINIHHKIKTMPGRRWNSLLKTWQIPYNRGTVKRLISLGFDISDLPQQAKEYEIEQKISFDSIKKQITKTYPFLYDYQLDAVAKGYINGRLLNADFMGLGKTLEGFAPMDRWLDKGKIEKVIIFCPSSIKWQWKKEILRWFKKLAIVIEGTPKQREALYKSDAKIMIFNYEQILRDFGKIYEISKEQGLILDEATYVKNPDAKRTQYVSALTPKYLFALTGTPIENKLKDAYNIGTLVYPDWMSINEFYSYCNFDSVYGGITGYKHLDIFMDRLMEISIRRTWDDVGIEGPKQIVENRFIQLTKFQSELEERIINILDEDLKSGESKSVFQKFVILPMLEDSTQLINLSPAKSLRNIGKVRVSSPKLVELEKLIEELPDKKIIIFTRFKKMANIIFDKLGEKYDCLIATGTIANTPKKKEIIKEKFRTSNSRILVSTECMTLGVNMPFISVCVNFDIPWKPTTLDQRIHRCYRVNSKYERLLIVNMISEGLESYIYKVMKEKEALSKEVTDFDINRQLLSFIRGHINSTKSKKPL